MDRLKVCIVGFGSIAKRHIANLAKICQDQKINLSIDLYRSGFGKEIEPQFLGMIHAVYQDSRQMPKDYDVIFITNPTECHLQSLEELKGHGNAFFIEKPLATLGRLQEADLTNLTDGKLSYVACPLRFKKVIQYAKNQIDLSTVHSVRVISSSYLPDWRPGTDYRKVYSARKELGGGVSIDLIHEWDYVKYLFGMPRKVFSFHGRVSDLDIDSEDIALYIADYGTMAAEIHLDYFGREPIREMQLFTADDTIRCDLIKNEICYLKSKKEVRFEESRDHFQIRELQYFLEVLDGKKENFNTVLDAANTLWLTGGIVKQ